MTHHIRYLSLALALALPVFAPSSSAVRADDVTRHLAVTKSEGRSWHDLYVAYQGDVKLTDVEITVTFYFENGTKETKKAYYGTWNTGTQKTVWIYNNSQGTIQRVDISGTATGPKGSSISINGNFRF